MINFDSLTLKAFINENREVFLEGRVQKVQQPSKNELLLTLRSLGKTRKLYISVDPQYPHMCFLDKGGESFRNLEIPQKPPMFCMLLRKHMEGVKILDVNQPEHERIFEIYFEGYNEIGARTPLVLAIEFMGKSSNIVLYSLETHVIMGCAHFVSSEKSRERELAGGLPYIYPPKQKKISLKMLSPEKFYELSKAIPDPMDVWLNKSFFDISLAVARDVCKLVGIDYTQNMVSVSKDQIAKLYEVLCSFLGLENIAPSVSVDSKFYSLFDLKHPDSKQFESVNTMLDKYFGYHVNQDKVVRYRNELRVPMKRELKKLRSSFAQHEKTLASMEKGDKYRQYADLIMANLYRITPNSAETELENFYDDNSSVKIALDPSISASDNAQKYYKLYNKSKNAVKYAEELLENAKADLLYSESIMYSIENCTSFEELDQIKAELEAQGYLGASFKKKKQEKVQVEEYESADGLIIYLGKNNKQNDYIVSKLSEPNDYWVHTHNIPGSHVLVKMPKHTEEIPEQTLHDAVMLAAYYSQARGSSMVPVIYTRRKFLKKPPAAKPGYVTYSNEKTLFVNPDEKFLIPVKSA